MIKRNLKTSEQFQKKIDSDFCFKFFEPYPSRSDMIRTAGFNILVEPLIATILIPISAIVSLAFAAKALIHPKNRLDNLKEAPYFMLIAISSAIYACGGCLIRIIETVTRLCGTKQPSHYNKSLQEITNVAKDTFEDMKADFDDIVAQDC